jgi:predicted N-formylglutamate amidohydrolase
MEVNITQFPPPPGSLLGPNDPAPFEFLNLNGSSQLLLTCDHASRAVPWSLGQLGLPPEQLDRHIAYDIGAAAITRILSDTLNAQSILAGFSRLVIDVNRPPGHPQSVPKVSDRIEIPANKKLSKIELNQRISMLFDPYHKVIADSIANLWCRGPAPVLFSIHSFTPHFENQKRPWDVGILWKKDPRLSEPLMEKLAWRGFCVGNNKPYSALDLAYTIDTHAGAVGLTNCAIEIRQDLISNQLGVEKWAKILTEDLSEILKESALYQVREH